MKRRKEQKKKIAVYNPTSSDLVVTYDVSGKGKPVEFKIPATQIAHFDPSVVDHVKKHLVNLLINEHGSHPNVEDAKKRYMREISLDIFEDE